METSELRDLIIRISNKEETALEEFYVNCGRVIYDAALRVVLNRMDSEEIVNDVLNRIWNNAHKISKLSNPLGYIVVMAHNLAIDYYRRHKRRKTVLIDEKEIKEIPAENKVDIKAVLSKLDEQERTILVLKSIYHYSYEEISGVTDLSVKKIRLRYEKALAEYKKAYDEEVI
jgi:RNA polymerase sigma-70 factor (ECF subfamily)